MREIFLQMLHDEVKPALGCTEPVAVALACAKAREILGDTKIVKAQITTSNNIFKNGMCVGIPGTKRLGLTIAACLGIVGGNSDKGLKVLEGMDKESMLIAEKMMDDKIVFVKSSDTIERVYVNVILTGTDSESEITIVGRHDNIVYIRHDKETILSNMPIADKDQKEINVFDNITLKTIIEICETYTENEINFLWEGVEMNKAMAMYGLENEVGAQSGRSIKAAIDKGEMHDDLLGHAMMWTAAASDARMSGASLSVMSSNGSGNHGLTAILPIAAYADLYATPRIKVLRALAMSHLMTAFIKSYTGRLSAVCGCGVAAATGATLGISYLMDLGYDGQERAIELMIAGISGMICDGAKAGCAVKLAIAASAAIESCYMAKHFSSLPKFNGIVGRSVEESVRNLGTVCNLGMLHTDKVILDVMNEMNRE